jgi:hypothetical protein
MKVSGFLLKIVVSNLLMLGHVLNYGISDFSRNGFLGIPELIPENLIATRQRKLEVGTY